MCVRCVSADSASRSPSSSPSRCPVLRTSPPPQSARPLPRGRPVDHRPDHALGLPVLRALSLCTCCRQYPGAATGRRLRSSRPAVSAFPEVAVGSACTSTFSELARRSLALRPAHSRRHLYVTSYTEGFSHFVASMTAPVASGWSVRRVGLAPTGKRRLLTAHANTGHCPSAHRMGQIDPELPYVTGSTNGRCARESGLLLKRLKRQERPSLNKVQTRRFDPSRSRSGAPKCE